MLSIDVDPRRQTAFLVALAAVIRSSPKTTYMHEMATVRLETCEYKIQC